MASGQTVTVCAKLPHGLTLRIFNMVETSEPVMGGGFRTVKVAQERAERVVLNGWSHQQNMAPEHQIVGGFALTHNVDKEFWDLWVLQNKDSDMVKNKMIFAHDKAGSAEAEAREKAKVITGLAAMDRIDPENLPVKGIKTAKSTG